MILQALALFKQQYISSAINSIVQLLFQEEEETAKDEDDDEPYIAQTGVLVNLYSYAKIAIEVIALSHYKVKRRAA